MGYTKEQREEKARLEAEKGGGETKVEDNSELMSVLKGVASGVEALAKDVSGLKARVKDIETGGKDRFKSDVKSEDVESASQSRSRIDPKIVGIVNEMLGEDFGIEITPRGDQPGFLFTLIVPHRLSDNVQDNRPVMDKATGVYKRDTKGDVVFEDYMPEDRRSRNISSTDSFEAIKQHCEKVRGYIVSYYVKMSKPLPEFRVK